MAATITKDIALNVLGQIQQYQQSVAQIPGVTEAAAARAAVAMQAVFVKQAKDQLKVHQDTAQKMVAVSKDAAKQTQAAFSGGFADAAKKIQSNQMISQLETIGSLFIQVGGNVSRLAGVFTSLVRPVATVGTLMGSAASSFALAGGAATALVVGVGVATAAFFKLASGAVEAGDRLREMNVQISTEQRAQLDAYAAGTEALAIATDRASVSMGSGFAETIGAVKRAFAEAKTYATNFADALDDSSDSWAYWIGNLVSGRAAFEELLRPFKESNAAVALGKRRSEEYIAVLEDQKRLLSENAKAFSDEVRAIVEKSKALGGLTDASAASDKADAERKRAAEEQARLLDQQTRGYRDYQRFSADVARGFVSEDVVIMNSAEERFRRLQEFRDADIISAEEYAKSWVDIEARMNAELQDLREKQAMESLNAQIKMSDQQKEVESDKYDTFLQMNAGLINAYVEGYQVAFDAWAAYAAQTLKSAQAGLDKVTKASDKNADKIKDIEAEMAEYRTSTENTTADAIKYAENEKTLAILEGDQRQLDRQKQMAAEQLAEAKKQALNQAKAQKALSVLTIGIKTAEAIMTAYAIFGPPPSPPGMAAAAAAVLSGGVQAAAVLAEPLPEFFHGTSRIPVGTDGSANVRLHAGEAVLTSTAAQELGPQIIDALNAGLSPLSAMHGGVGDVLLDGRLVGRVLAKQARSAGSFGRSVRKRPVGYVDPYGRR